MKEQIEIDPMTTAVFVGIAILLIIIGLVKNENGKSGGSYIIGGIIVALLGTINYIMLGLIYIVPVAVIFGVIWAIINWKKF